MIFFIIMTCLTVVAIAFILIGLSSKDKEYTQGSFVFLGLLVCFGWGIPGMLLPTDRNKTVTKLNRSDIEITKAGLVFKDNFVCKEYREVQLYKENTNIFVYQIVRKNNYGMDLTTDYIVKEGGK